MAVLSECHHADEEALSRSLSKPRQDTFVRDGLPRFGADRRIEEEHYASSEKSGTSRSGPSTRAKSSSISSFVKSPRPGRARSLSTHEPPFGSSSGRRRKSLGEIR